MTSDEYIDLALRVLARALVREMSHGQYPTEWSRPPLNELLPLLYELLNYHPAHLGQIIRRAYNNTFPISESGNINQLGYNHKRLFGFSEKRYQDEYKVRKLTKYSGDITFLNDRIPSNLMREIAERTIDIFTQLKPDQENEHRTLEHLVGNIYPLFTLDEDMGSIGFDLIEYSDFWRQMNNEDRVKLAKKITHGWPK